jgi:hypothetical protein
MHIIYFSEDITSSVTRKSIGLSYCMEVQGFKSNYDKTDTFL